MPSFTAPLTHRPQVAGGLLLLLLSLSGYARPPYPFSVEAERVGQEHRLIAHNRGPAPVSVKLWLTNTDNAASEPALPFFAVVRPYSEVALARIFGIDRNRGHRFATQAVYQTGNYFAIHDSGARYRLPFENNRTFVITQAPGGLLTSHTQADNENAIDITMPQGTPVVAAREGTVIEVEAGNRSGAQEKALLKMANFVRILHADETTAVYAHLAPNGVLVQPGQKVSAGTMIGLSGSTGYSSGPHLHFAVHKIVRKGENFEMVSLPVQFYVGDPAHVFTPQLGQQVTADYSGPGKAPPLVQIISKSQPPMP